MTSRAAVTSAYPTMKRPTPATVSAKPTLLVLRVLAISLALSSIAACGYIDTDSLSTVDPTNTSTSTIATTDLDTSVALPMAPEKVASYGGTSTQTDTPGSSLATGVVNSLDTIVNDMKLRNDLVLRGYESKTVGWYVGPGYVQMGNQARTSNTPQWFKDAYPHLINDNPLQAFLPWIVLFDGVGHAATNTRVHFRNMKAFYKSKRTGQWVSWGSSPGVSGYATPKVGLFGGTVPEDKRVNSDGSVEIKPPADPNLAWHGWWSRGRVPIDAADIDAVFVTVQARLVVDNPSLPDDRSAARLLFHVGADYYIDTNTSWTVPQPGVGVSRAKQITNDWQAISLTTFSNVGVQEPGGGITETAFRSNPPPLD